MNEVTLWTLQHPSVWQTLQDSGVYRASYEHVDPDFLRHYAWLERQMEARVGPRPAPGTAMTWAWRYWHGTRRPRPDMRSRHVTRGLPLVLLELRVPRSLFLESDFIGWNSSLNNGQIADGEEEDDAFDDWVESRGHMTWHDAVADPVVWERITETWVRLLDLSQDNPYWTRPIEEKRVQATLWELRIDMVCKARSYIAR